MSLTAKPDRLFELARASSALSDAAAALALGMTRLADALEAVCETMAGASDKNESADRALWLLANPDWAVQTKFSDVRGATVYRMSLKGCSWGTWHTSAENAIDAAKQDNPTGAQDGD